MNRRVAAVLTQALLAALAVGCGGATEVPEGFDTGAQDLSSPAVCTYRGKIYRPGDRFPSADGCNTCACRQGGEIVCTQRACAPCRPGAVFPAPDGCNTCSCGP